MHRRSSGLTFFLPAVLGVLLLVSVPWAVSSRVVSLDVSSGEPGGAEEHKNVDATEGVAKSLAQRPRTRRPARLPCTARASLRARALDGRRAIPVPPSGRPPPRGPLRLLC
jgi:hypothetical protein